VSKNCWTGYPWTEYGGHSGCPDICAIRTADDVLERSGYLLRFILFGHRHHVQLRLPGPSVSREVGAEESSIIEIPVIFDDSRASDAEKHGRACGPVARHNQSNAGGTRPYRYCSFTHLKPVTS
jgi:hypothetical protein